MTTDRAAYIAGWRRLLDLLETNEDIPLPYEGKDPQYGRLNFHFLNRDGTAKARIAAAARALPVSLTKVPRSDQYFELHGNLDGLYFRLATWREAVCERVVIGTETITRTMPDPAVIVPTIEVTEEVELTEWRCGPILTDAS